MLSGCVIEWVSTLLSARDRERFRTLSSRARQHVDARVERLVLHGDDTRGAARASHHFPSVHSITFVSVPSESDVEALARAFGRPIFLEIAPGAYLRGGRWSEGHGRAASSCTLTYGSPTDLHVNGVAIQNDTAFVDPSCAQTVCQAVARMVGVKHLDVVSVTAHASGANAWMWIERFPTAVASLDSLRLVWGCHACLAGRVNMEDRMAQAYALGVLCPVRVWIDMELKRPAVATEDYVFEDACLSLLPRHGGRLKHLRISMNVQPACFESDPFPVTSAACRARGVVFRIDHFVPPEKRACADAG